jgi:hypothetical protein
MKTTMKRAKFFLMKVVPSKYIYFLCTYLFLYLLLFCGCNRNQELIIKGAKGEITEKFIPTNDSTNRIKYISFHINGTIKEEGFLHHGERDGIWKQFYNDGALRWVGRYLNGRSEVPEMDSTVIENTSISGKGVTPDGYYSFRLKLPDSLSYNELMFTVTNANLRLNYEFDSSDFEIKPKVKNEAIILKIYAVSVYAGPIFGIKLDSLRLKSLR